MNQSAYIAAILLAGFVLFVAARNRLKVYADVLFGPAPGLPPFLGIPLLTVGAPAAPAAPSGGGSAVGGAANDNAGNAAANENWLGTAETVVGDAAKAGEVAAAIGL